MKPEGSIKQGSVGIHPSSDVITDAYKESVEKAVEVYTGMIDISVAPEQARFVLPQGMESTTIFTGSVVTWERMIVLRTDSHAQLEIQELARQCEEQLLRHTTYSLT
jgi:thymidylate synthase (FAD)